MRITPRTTKVPLPGILHSMSFSSLAASLPLDGRQSPTARAVARGTTRLLHALGFSVVSELPLPSGRRADLVALSGDGEVWIVEIKSSVADFRADQKWMDYRRHSDRLGAEIVCEAPEHRLHAATRRVMMLAFARAAALRLSALVDPEGPYGSEI
jgi:hypothetical protein